jgi:hypothetical protein
VGADAAPEESSAGRAAALRAQVEAVRSRLRRDGGLYAKRGIAITTATAVFATLGAAGTAALAEQPSPEPTQPTPATEAPAPPEAPLAGPPRWGELGAPSLSAAQARARLEELLRAAEAVRRAGEQRLLEQQYAATLAEQQQHHAAQLHAEQQRLARREELLDVRQPQVVQLPQTLPAKTPEQLAEEEAQARVAEAEARIQEALQALARALSSGACTTTGGTGGTAASISCPVADGQGSITGDGSTAVTGLTAPTPGDTGDDLTAAAAPSQVTDAAPLSPDAAQAALDRARAQWLELVPSAALSGTTVAVEDLPGLQLGESRGTVVVVDTDAAGWGWGSDGMDLTTVLRHELGHTLGLEHTTTGVMADTLEPGVVRTVDSAAAAAALGAAAAEVVAATEPVADDAVADDAVAADADADAAARAPATQGRRLRERRRTGRGWRAGRAARRRRDGRDARRHRGLHARCRRSGHADLHRRLPAGGCPVGRRGRRAAGLHRG